MGPHTINVYLTTGKEVMKTYHYKIRSLLGAACMQYQLQYWSNISMRGRVKLNFRLLFCTPVFFCFE